MKQAELELLVENMGGILDLSDLGDPFEKILGQGITGATILVDEFRQQMPNPWRNRPLQIAITRSSAIDACAAKTDDCDYIFVTAGTVAAIEGTMAGLMSSPTFLPTIGDGSKEEEPNGPFRQGFPPFPLLRRKGPHPRVSYCYPADTARHSFGMLMAEMAIDFLLFHEVGHVLAGHLELIDNDGFGRELFELRQTTSRGMPPALRRILECDADSFATHTSSFVSLHPDSDQLWSEVFGWRNVPGNEAAFIAHAIAIGVLFRLIDGDGVAPRREPDAEYPHPAIRSSLNISKSFGLAVVAKRFELKDLSRLVQQSLILLEKAWTQHDLPGRRLGRQTDWAEQVRTLSVELERQYRAQMPMLCRHTRVPTRWHGLLPSWNQ